MNDDRGEDQGIEQEQAQMGGSGKAALPEQLWSQIRKLIVFQFKLYLDAFRDLLFSPLSLGACLLDLLTQKSGPDSYFERVLKIGRRTELAINLFNQHDSENQRGHSVDSVLRDVEERIRR